MKKVNHAVYIFLVLVFSLACMGKNAEASSGFENDPISGDISIEEAEASYAETFSSDEDFSENPAFSIEETFIEETFIKETFIKETFIEETFIEETFIEDEDLAPVSSARKEADISDLYPSSDDQSEYFSFEEIGDGSDALIQPVPYAADGSALPFSEPAEAGTDDLSDGRGGSFWLNGRLGIAVEAVTCVRSAGNELEGEITDVLSMLQSPEDGSLMGVLINTYRVENGARTLIMRTLWQVDGQWLNVELSTDKTSPFESSGIYNLYGDWIFRIELSSDGQSKGAGGYRLFVTDEDSLWAYFLTSDDIKESRHKEEINGYLSTLPDAFYAGIQSKSPKRAGLQTVNGAIRYLNENGTVARGVTKVIDGVTYDIDARGIGTVRESVTPGWVTFSDGTVHWQNADGTYIEKAGFYKLDAYYYYIKSTGARYKGWLIRNGKKYFLNRSNGVRQVGYKKIDGNWYYFNAGGVMQTGFVAFSGGTRYFDLETGAEVFGFADIGGVTYYFDEGTGYRHTKWLVLPSGKYYFNNKGIEYFGLNTVNGRQYIFDDETGVMLKKLHGYDHGNGQYYSIAANGVITPITYEEYLAGSRLDACGSKLKSAFQWCAGDITLEDIEYTYESDEERFLYLARRGLLLRSGDSMTMAAAFCLIARQAGYEAHLMEGKATVSGETITTGWAEVVTDNGIRVCDPYFAKQSGKSGYMFAYGAKGTWTYTDYRKIV